MKQTPGRFTADRALALLRVGVGDSRARFRGGQEEAIRHVFEGSGRLLVVQKTGWGKSFVYFVATKLLREAGMGPALLVSPLLALMRNQIAAAERMGVRAETINSDNQGRWREVEAAIRRDEADIVLIAPERFANERFNNEVLAQLADRISLIVVDEAHCISDWGHDFRPDYRRIERTLRVLPRNLRLLATTATANNRVMDDLRQILGPNLTTSRGDLARPSLALQTMRMPSQAERLAWLSDLLPDLPGSGIVYTLTIRDAEQVARWLRTRGIDAEAYTGKSGERRAELEQALLDNKVKALVATTALGMGFDKPDLAFVVHYQTPGSVVAYYQQVGRAGRALDAAYGVLLSGTEETEITNYFIASAFPTRSQVAAVLEALEAAPDGLSIREIEAEVNVSHGRIQKTIQLLALESPAPIATLGRKWQLTAARLSEGFWERTERLTELRRTEQQQMQQYVDLSSGHMEFLIRSLDGDRTNSNRPRCPNCGQPCTPPASGTQSHFSATQTCRLSRAGNGQTASGSSTSIVRNQVGPFASGEMPAGDAWWRKECSETIASPTSLWTRARPWFGSGSPSRVPPGLRPCPRAVVRAWCPTLPDGWPLRCNFLFGSCLSGRKSGRSRRRWRTATSRRATSSDRWRSTGIRCFRVPCFW